MAGGAVEWNGMVDENGKVRSSSMTSFINAFLIIS
jgi:hypothetical protein